MRKGTLAVNRSTMKNRVKKVCGHMSLGAILPLYFFSRITVQFSPKINDVSSLSFLTILEVWHPCFGVNLKTNQNLVGHCYNIFFHYYVFFLCYFSWGFLFVSVCFSVFERVRERREVETRGEGEKINIKLSGQVSWKEKRRVGGGKEYD